MAPQPDALSVRRDDISAVLVSYYPDHRLREHIEAALSHVGSLLVVDNTPGEPTGPVQDVEGVPGVDVHRFGSNRGVGAALNAGLEHARRQGHEWLLTLDQDTLLSSEWPLAVDEGYRAGGEGTAVVGVGFHNPLRTDTPTTSGLGADEVDRVITSGSLWSISALDAVGGFREDFFVDAIDHEACFRLRARGYLVMRSRRAVMDHEMGPLQPVAVFGKTYGSSGYSALRYYYIFRNFVETARIHGRNEPAWLHEDAQWLWWMVKSAVANRSLKKLGAIARGTADGLLRRFESVPQFLLD